MQSKRVSFIESVINIVIGYVVALCAQSVIFPWFGIHIDLDGQAQIAGVFTVVSVVRSYCVRRFFNLATVRGWW